MWLFQRLWKLLVTWYILSIWYICFECHLLYITRLCDIRCLLLLSTSYLRISHLILNTMMLYDVCAFLNGITNIIELDCFQRLMQFIWYISKNISIINWQILVNAYMLSNRVDIYLISQILIFRWSYFTLLLDSYVFQNRINIA